MNEPDNEYGFIKNKFKEYIDARGFSLNEVGKRCGVGVYSVARLYHDSTNRSDWNFLCKLFHGLQCTWDDLFEYVPYMAMTREDLSIVERRKVMAKEKRY